MFVPSGSHPRKYSRYLSDTSLYEIGSLGRENKAYNIDKMLEFLSGESSVFMFYFVGIDPIKIVDTVLISIFQKDLLSSTILLKHWAGRNSRGVTQFEGSTIKKLILESNSEIHGSTAVEFLENLISIP